jgi:hypothetical protein
MTKRVLKVFVGYQLKSKFHTSSYLKTIISQKIGTSVKKKLGITLDCQFGDKFTAGGFLFSQVQDAINNCEVAIFDISENNPNVMIEVGMALGAKKFTIIIKNESSSHEFPIPSDIKAFIYIPYKKLENIIHRVKTAISNYSKNLTPSHLFYKQIWGFSSNDIVHIVCPELEEPYNRQNPEDNEFLYLGKYGDIDSLITLFSSLSKLYPNINFKFCTGKEFKGLRPAPNPENLILLGGPDYNPITKYYMNKTKKIPYKFIVVNDSSIGIKLPKKGQTIEACFEDEDNSRQGSDCGFFVKFCNPYNKNKRVFMINGIHTYGVYGAAKCFSVCQDGDNDVSIENCKKVINKIGDNCNFAVHFSVQIMQNETGIPTIKTANILRLP